MLSTNQMHRQLIKVNERICLLFGRTVIKHDMIIINFGRNWCWKYHLFSTPITENVFSTPITETKWKRLGSLVIITQLFNVLYVQFSTANILPLSLRQMYEKFRLRVRFLSEFSDNRRKVDWKVRRAESVVLKRRRIRLPHTPLLNP